MAGPTWYCSSNQFYVLLSPYNFWGPFMGTKHMCVMSEVGIWLVPSGVFGPSSNFLTERSKAVPLLWILFVACVLCLTLSHCLVCSLQLCDHLLG